jgi:hypothetical protein
MLEGFHIPFVYIFGNMTSKAKEQSIKTFKYNPGIKVMVSIWDFWAETLGESLIRDMQVAGLQCASEAHNFTVANRVIIVDLWYNVTRELQAFSRVYRHGQTKETYLWRLLSKKSDDDTRAMQERKAVDVNYALRDDGHTPDPFDDETLAIAFDPVKDEEKSKGRKGKSTSPKK